MLTEPNVHLSHSPETLEESGCDAVRAIALCWKGAIEDGIALYKKVLKTHPHVDRPLPVGVHLKILESMGLYHVSNIIRRSALAAGADICFSRVMERTTAATIDE